MGYSTSSGTSLDRQILTTVESEEALQKLTKYLSENVRATGSASSISMDSSVFSTLVCCRSVTDPLPISPWDENLIPSLFASIVTVIFSDQQPHLPDMKASIRSAYQTQTWP